MVNRLHSFTSPMLTAQSQLTVDTYATGSNLGCSIPLRTHMLYDNPLTHGNTIHQHSKMVNPTGNGGIL